MRKEVPTRRLLRALGRRIAEARVAAELTQEGAARASGIPYKRWQRIEQGAVNPTVRTLAVMAHALGMEFWDLVQAPAPVEAHRQSREKR